MPVKLPGAVQNRHEAGINSMACTQHHLLKNRQLQQQQSGRGSGTALKEISTTNKH